MNIIGLGRAGCQVADTFNKWSQYNTLCIDVENKEYNNFMKIERQNTHEDYEKNFVSLELDLPAEPTTLFVCGAGAISGLSLRILESIQDKHPKIFYIKPDVSTLSSLSKTRHKVTFGVLQQYARSNLLENMYVADNKSVESMLENISIVDYWKDINNVISGTYHMINFFENTEPLLSSHASIGKTSKIATFTVVNYDTFKERAFYNLVKPRFKKYFFGINENTLQEEKDLLGRIRNFIKDTEDENIHSSFSIYSTEYEHNYVYSVHYASLIQEENIP